MEKGLLHRKGKLVVPRQLRRIVLHLAHGTAHEGVTATAKNLKDFYWPKKAEHIKQWYRCRGCECSKAKLTTRPEGNKIFDSYQALRCLVVDYMVDTVKHSSSRHIDRYILMMVDRATGFCRMAITKSRSASDTALAIKENWIADFGCPEIIMSDNEGAMTSDLTEYLCRAVWMAKLVFFAPYQKTGGGIVERAIQNAEKVVRSSVAAGDVNKDGTHMDSWIKNVEWDVNAAEGANESSAFENLYGVPPMSPLRMAVPISLHMNEADRRKWQTTLRERNEDGRVRNAFNLHTKKRKRGDELKDKASNFKGGTAIWARQEGSGVSALDPDRWQKGTLVEQRKGQRSAMVRIEGQRKDKVRRTAVIRRRYKANNDVPNEKDIEEALSLNDREDEEERVDEGIGMELSPEEEERVEETSQEDDGSEEEKDTEFHVTIPLTQRYEEDEEETIPSTQLEEEDDEETIPLTQLEEEDDEETIPPTQFEEADEEEIIPPTQPEGEDEEKDEEKHSLRQARRNGRKRRNESSGTSERRTKRVKFAETPLTQKEVIVIRDKNNNQAYLSLLNEATGKFILMKRTSSRKKREYHPVWWKNNTEGRMMQKAQKKRPGEEWELWECSQDMMQEETRFGRILEDSYKLPHEYDQRFLAIAGNKKKKKKKKQKRR